MFFDIDCSVAKFLLHTKNIDKNSWLYYLWLSRYNLNNTLDLRNRNLKGCEFEGDISYTDFSGSDMSGCKFKDIVGIGCNFKNTNLTKATFENAYLRDSSFKGAKMDRVVFGGSLSFGCDFSKE
jgi:uncharacterized protein YjbI with pentapeptide repeats